MKSIAALAIAARAPPAEIAAAGVTTALAVGTVGVRAAALAPGARSRPPRGGPWDRGLGVTRLPHSARPRHPGPPTTCALHQSAARTGLQMFREVATGLKLVMKGTELAFTGAGGRWQDSPWLGLLSVLLLMLLAQWCAPRGHRSSSHDPVRKSSGAAAPRRCCSSRSASWWPSWSSATRGPSARPRSRCRPGAGSASATARTPWACRRSR